MLHVVRGAWSVKWCTVRLSVHLSVFPFVCHSMDLQQQIRRCRFAAVDPVGSRYHRLLQQQRANAGSATLSVYVIAFAFSALTLLDRLQEEHLACKNRVMRCWCLERSADRLHVVRLMPLHPQTPSSLASFTSRLGLLFW